MNCTSCDYKNICAMDLMDIGCIMQRPNSNIEASYEHEQTEDILDLNTLYDLIDNIKSSWDDYTIDKQDQIIQAMIPDKYRDVSGNVPFSYYSHIQMLFDE